MRTVMTFALALLVTGWCAREASAMGSDHPKKRLAAQGLTCVHGYWINESDVFFYAGDAADFNKFAAELAKRQGAKLQIVIHKGTKKARSPWDKADRDIVVDWSVTTGPIARGVRVAGEADLVRMDLWFWGQGQGGGGGVPARC